MTTNETCKKAKKRLENACKSVKGILDNELNKAIDLLVILAYDMNLSLEELLSDKPDKLIGTIIDSIFKHCGNNCESGYDTLRQIETEYIAASYNYLNALMACNKNSDKSSK